MYMTLQTMFFFILGRKVIPHAECLSNLEVVGAGNIPASILARYFVSEQFQDDVTVMCLEIDERSHDVNEFQIVAIYSPASKQVVFQISPTGSDPDCIEIEQ